MMAQSCGLRHAFSGLSHEDLAAMAPFPKARRQQRAAANIMATDAAVEAVLGIIGKP